MEMNESDFNFSELFFSRTDRRGFVISGNSVFQRISEFDWNELLNHPHNVVRHADMPRGVFHLFWKRLLAGKPIGAFVKNKARSGKYYWVFALAQPVGEGFVSIRLKPSGKIFETIQAEYKNLLLEEKQKKISPEASEEILHERIKALGFKDYDTFMIEAFMECIQGRDDQLKRTAVESLSDLQKLQEDAALIMEKASATILAYKQTAFVPLNLEIHTNQIGNAAAPLAVVASKYDGIAKEVQTGMEGFKASSQLVYDKVIQAKFEICSAILQNEMYHYFKSEKGEYLFNVQEEMQILQGLRIKSLNNSIKSLREIEKEIITFERSCEGLKTLSTGLEIIRLMGRIEIVKLEGDSVELESMISLLQNFKVLLTEELRKISQLGKQIRELTLVMMEDRFFSETKLKAS